MDGTLEFEQDPETGDVVYGPRQTTPAAPEVRDLTNMELASELDDHVLDDLASTLTDNIDRDRRANTNVDDLRSGYIELMGIGEESDPDDVEEGSDTSDHPLLLTAVLRFQAKALSALLPSDDKVVRTKPAVDTDSVEDLKERHKVLQECTEAGERVAAFYTEYLLERLPDYEEGTDQLLFDMGLLGAGLRKVYTDRSYERAPVRADYIPLEDLTISYDGTRYTHTLRMSTPELVRRVVKGIYRPVDLATGASVEVNELTEARDRILGLTDPNDDNTHVIYEHYCNLFLEDDPHPLGLARPYVVSIHERTQTILSVQRNWSRSDPEEARLENFVFYIYHPGKSGTRGIGLGAILGNLTRALRKSQRESLEAAYFQNHPSGFKLSSLSIRDEATKVKKGQFVDVDAPNDDIRRALMPHPFNGPSPALQTLSDSMERNGKELGGIASLDFTQLMKSGVTAGPAMAAFEESSEFQTSVHRRLYQSNRYELKLIHDHMRAAFSNQEVVFGDGLYVLRPQDLQMVEVLPYMKPGQVSRQKDILEAQATLELSSSMPDIIDKRKAAEDYLRAIGRPNIDDIMLPAPQEQEVDPQDPVTEYMLITQGKPVRAGPSQNHRAHIDAHTAQLRMILSGTLPTEIGEPAAAAMTAHIAEHHAQDMLTQVASRLGIPLEQFGQMPPEVEAQIAPMVAEAIVEIEALRMQEQGDTGTGDNGEKLQIEQIRQEAQRAREADKAAHEARMKQQLQDHERRMLDVKNQHAIELQRIKDDAAMERELEDNAAALAIASKKADAGTRTSAGASSGALSRTPKT